MPAIRRLVLVLFLLATAATAVPFPATAPSVMADAESHGVVAYGDTREKAIASG